MSRNPNISFEVWGPTALLIAGLFWFLIIPSWQNISGSWRASTWSPTSATVVRSRAKESTSQERRHTVYVFEYKYQVGGRAYTSGRYSFRYANGDRRTAVKLHSEGDEIVAYYAPDNPSQSVIERNSNPWWNYLVLSLVVLIPIALFVQWRNLMRTSKPTSDRRSANP